MRWRTLPRCSAFVWKDVGYVAHEAAHANHKLDIAVPKATVGKRRLPTCVFVHGGSWQRGDKSGGLNGGIDEAFARAGFIGVSVNYRLSPEVKHPEHARDVAAAVRWLHDHIETFGGDPERMVLVGHSAGAHLVMQVLADPQFMRDAGLNRTVAEVVKAAVGISGVYNIVRIANTAIYGDLVASPAFGDRVEEWRKASIASVVTQAGKESPILQIPLLLITAEQDFHFEKDAQELEKWLVDAGHTRVERQIVHDTNHFTIVQDLTQDGDDHTMAMIKSFIADL